MSSALARIAEILLQHLDPVDLDGAGPPPEAREEQLAESAAVESKPRKRRPRIKAAS